MADRTVRAPSAKREFYVYILYRPDGRPCYVGKGKGHRWKSHERLTRLGQKHHNSRLQRIIRKAGGPLFSTKTDATLSEPEAFELERFLIQLIGRDAHGGPLVNFTDGGEGVTGLIMPPDAIEKMAKAKRGRPNVGRIGLKHSPESLAKMSASHQGHIVTDETRRKMSESHSGKLHSSEWNANVSAALTGRKLSEGHVASLRLKKRTPEQCERIKVATIQAMQDPVIRAKMPLANY